MSSGDSTTLQKETKPGSWWRLALTCTSLSTRTERISSSGGNLFAIERSVLDPLPFSSVVYNPSKQKNVFRPVGGGVHEEH